MTVPTSEVEADRGVRGLILPMAVVVAPQTALAAVQHSLAVLGPVITDVAGLPPEGIGLIGGLTHAGAVWFFASSSAVIGPLGPVRSLIAACLVSAGAAAAMLSGLTALMLLAAPLIGFAYASTAPAGSAILAAATPRRLWGTLFSIRMAGVPAGGAIAGVVAAGVTVASSWRHGLIAITLLPLTCALFLFIAGRPLRAPGWAAPKLSEVASVRNLATPLRTLRRAPALRRLTVASLGFAAAQSGAFTFLTTYLTQSLGLTLALAGALFATMQGASFAGRILVGILADYLGSRKAILTSLGLLSAVSTALLALATPAIPIPVLFLGAAAAGACVATWNGLFLAEIAAVSPEDAISDATAAATFFTFIGYMVAPVLFAAVATSLGYREAYLLTSISALLAAIHLGMSR